MLRDYSPVWKCSFKEFRPLIEKFHKGHLEEILWLLFANGASVILGLAIIKIIATIGTAEYGKFALVLSIVPLANAIIYGPIDFFCQRYYYSYAYDNNESIFLYNVIHLIINLFLSLCLLIIIILVVLKIALKYDLPSLLFWLVSCTYILFFTSSVPLSSLLNTMRMRKLVALFSSGEKFLQLIILLFIFRLVHLDSSLVLLVFVTVAALSLAAKVKIIRNRALFGGGSNPNLHKGLPRDFLQLLVSFGIPLLGFGVLAWFQTNGERWALQLVMGLDSVGIFCFMAMVANTMFNLVQQPIANFITPITWEKFADLNDSGRVEEGLRIIRLTVGCFCLLVACEALFLLLFAKPLLTTLGSADFSSHYQLLPVILIGIGLGTVGHTLTAVGFGYNRMPAYTLPKASGAVMTIISCLIGAYYWGLAGVAWGLILTNSTYVFLVILANTKIIREHVAA